MTTTHINGSQLWNQAEILKDIVGDALHISKRDGAKLVQKIKGFVQPIGGEIVAAIQREKFEILTILHDKMQDVIRHCNGVLIGTIV